MNSKVLKASPIFSPRKKRKKESAPWALSYGDMVTALLCFFIIFYAIEKQMEKKTAAETKGVISDRAPAEEHKVDDIDADYQYTLESLEDLPGLEIHKSSSFVDIYFKKTVFFEKGKTDLTAQGKAAVDEVVEKLKKIDGRYLLEIQGHADRTPVKNKKTRWWKTNMELSVLRALNVHDYLAENYIERNNLVVAGHGNLRKISSEEKSNEELNRRISLRLQLIK
jgi:flagellar motor protein MotB